MFCILRLTNRRKTVSILLLTRYVSRVVKYLKKSFRHLTMFFMSTWWGPLNEGLQKYARNWNLTMAFWNTCKIAQPIKPIQYNFFALLWFALKKPSWELNFLHIFAISLSRRHENVVKWLFVILFHSIKYKP